MLMTAETTFAHIETSDDPPKSLLESTPKPKRKSSTHPSFHAWLTRERYREPVRRAEEM